ncbi:MAG TPA: pyrroline-5-carboxylate reductase [Rickettsiales bacterium]|nr:pyrroline-5-carboxylate reductase [Rickettsiales bacterium]
MSRFPESLLLLGAGKMGSALLAAWHAHGMRKDAITVVDSHITQDGIINNIDDVNIAPECIVLAVKPQSMDELLPELAKKFGDAPLYISIAAGKDIAYFEKHLGDAAIVRTMPNTPALIGKGITALCANRKTSEAQKAVATALLEAAGETVWLENESLMDAVTAVSGSGPAYIFLLLEALTVAGVAQGLPEAICRKLAMSTVAGSAALAAASSKEFAQLRSDVTSKGGTTEAALSVLMKDDALKQLFADAVAAAVKRGKELH